VKAAAFTAESVGIALSGITLETLTYVPIAALLKELPRIR
jgi:hypothetical protein